MPDFAVVLLVAAGTLWVLVALAFGLNELGQRHAARAAGALLALDLFDLTFSDLGAGARTTLTHGLGLCAAWVMPAATLAFMIAVLARGRASRSARRRGGAGVGAGQAREGA